MTTSFVAFILAVILIASCAVSRKRSSARWHINDAIRLEETDLKDSLEKANSELIDLAAQARYYHHYPDNVHDYLDQLTQAYDKTMRADRNLRNFYSRENVKELGLRL